MQLFKSLGSVRFYVFDIIRLYLFNRKYSKNCNILKYYYNLKYLLSFLIDFEMYFIFRDGKAEFLTAITRVFSQCHVILQKSFLTADLVL